MDKKRIVVFKPLPDDVVALLEQHFTLIQADTHGAADQVRATLTEAFEHADGAIGSGVTIDAAMLEKATRLTVLSTASVGIDKFDPDDLTERGIVLTHTPDVLTETTADIVFALILASARRVVELADYVRQGRWRASVGAEMYGVDVHHKTIGIVGFGRIGQAVARRAALGFGMRVLYTSPRSAPAAEANLGARRVELDELLSQSDFVCLQAPLTASTRHMIGAKELASMKSTAILINGGRGALIDEPALIDALRDGVIRGAGLDVFYAEPVAADSALLSMPNVVGLPHVGSATHETRHAMALNAAENVISLLIDNVPNNVANPTVLSSTQCRLAKIGVGRAS